MLNRLIILHINASCERLFTFVNNNVARDRSNLVLESLEVFLMKKGKPKRIECFKTTFTAKE